MVCSRCWKASHRGKEKNKVKADPVAIKVVSVIHDNARSMDTETMKLLMEHADIVALFLCQERGRAILDARSVLATRLHQVKYPNPDSLTYDLDKEYHNGMSPDDIMDLVMEALTPLLYD